MTRVYAKTVWPARPARRALKKKIWFVHVEALEPGLTHYLIFASTLELAWDEAIELPRKCGTAPRLGAMLDETDWWKFVTKKNHQCCDICQRGRTLLTTPEALSWDLMADAYENGSKEVIE